MMQGGCTCGAVRYRLADTPLFVHCCHCTWCQRETGAAFALNALIEADRVELLSGAPDQVPTPSASGKGQEIARCPACRVAVWSHYAGDGRALAFVRVGTLDDPAACPPDIHIFTSTRLPWLDLGDRVPAVAEYYDRREYWPEASLARHRAMREKARARR